MAKEKVVFIGPSGVGKSQIVTRLTKREGGFNLGHQMTMAIENLEMRISQLSLNISAIGGSIQFQQLWPFYVKKASIVFVVLDVETLCSAAGSQQLANFLIMAKQNAPTGAEVRIIINKVDAGVSDRKSVAALAPEEKSQIEVDCKPHIDQAMTIALRTLELIESDIEEQVIFYSAAEQILTNKPLRDDPILQTMERLLKEKLTAPSEKIYGHYQSPDQKDEDAQSKLTLGKLLLLLLIFAIVTAFFITIGALIGGAAGLWSGPGAFFTAIAGGAAGAAVGWALAILIISPILGLAVTYKGFKEWEVAVEDDRAQRLAAEHMARLSPKIVPKDVDLHKQAKEYFDNPDLYNKSFQWQQDETAKDVKKDDKLPKAEQPKTQSENQKKL